MGCAAGTFEIRCKNPSCAYVPHVDGYCCSHCRKLHDESLQWDVKTNINTRSTTEDIKGHSLSPELPWPLCRIHLRGYWQDLGPQDRRRSFLYLALKRKGKELHCRTISGKEPVPRQGRHFDICLDRGMVLVQDAKEGDQLELKYQVGKQSRLLASGISVLLVPRDVEDVEHEMQCQQVTAQVSSRRRCQNPMCPYLADTGGFCCGACRVAKLSSSRGALRNLRVIGPVEEFQCLPGVVRLKSSVAMVHFHCWWRAQNGPGQLKLCLLRQKLEVAFVVLCAGHTPDWQLLQKVWEKDDPLVQEAQEGDELQVQYKNDGKLEVKQITVTTCTGDFPHAAACSRWAGASRKPPGGVRL